MEKISYSFSLGRLLSGDTIRQALKWYMGVLFYEEPLMLGNGQEYYFWGMRPGINHPITLVIVTRSHEPLSLGGKYLHLRVETMCPIGGNKNLYEKYLDHNENAVCITCAKISEELSAVLARPS